MSVIKELTKNCMRSDCRVVCDGGTSTLVAYQQAYDKEGNPVSDASDPNETTMHYRCLTCGAAWDHKTGGVK